MKCLLFLTLSLARQVNVLFFQLQQQKGRSEMTLL